MRGHRRGEELRSGFSLTEVLLAFAIVGIAAIPTISVVLDTNRRAARVATTFKEVNLCQMLWEGLKHRLSLNPFMVGNLGKVYGFQPGQTVLGSGERIDTLVLTASVWQHDSPPLDEQGTPIGSAFLTHYLLNPTAGDMYTVANRELDPAGNGAMTAPITQLLHNYRDLVYRITVADGPFSALEKDDDGNRVVLTGRDEYTKRIRIEIFDCRPGETIPASPSYALETFLETPGESLSLASYLARQKDLDDYSYEKDNAEAFLRIAFAGGELELDAERVTALSNLSLLFSQVVGESVRVSEDDLGFELDEAVRGIDFWIATLDSVGSMYASRQVAHLHERKALTIFEAFRRSYRPMSWLAAYTTDLRAAAEAYTAGLAGYQAKLDKWFTDGRDVKQAAAFIDQVTEPILALLEKLWFWASFFDEARYVAALERPQKWNRKFLNAINDAVLKRSQIDQDPRATPLERVANLNQYVELCKALKMFVEQDRIPEEGLVEQARTRYLSNFLALAEGLTQETLPYRATLEERNAAFTKIRDQLKSMDEEGNVFRITYENFRKFKEIVQEMQTRLVALDQKVDSKTWGGGWGGVDTQKRVDAKEDEGSKDADTVIKSEDLDFDSEEGPSPALLALRDILSRAEDLGDVGQLEALGAETRRLIDAGALDPTTELRIARLVYDSIDDKIQKLTGRSVAALPELPEPPPAPPPPAATSLPADSVPADSVPADSVPADATPAAPTTR